MGFTLLYGNDRQPNPLTSQRVMAGWSSLSGQCSTMAAAKSAAKFDGKLSRTFIEIAGRSSHAPSAPQNRCWARGRLRWGRGMTIGTVYTTRHR